MAARGQYDEDVYQRIGLDDLVTFAVSSLLEKGKEATFENLVVECYALFPRRFSLVGYPMYPDSALVNKSWLRCRTDKRLIDGSAAKGFKLTQMGLDVAEKTSFLLKDKTHQASLGRLKEEERSKASKFIQHIEGSAAYKKYLENESNPGISDFELRDVLLGTMQTRPDILLDNAFQLEKYAEFKSRGDLIRFITRAKLEVKRRFGSDNHVPSYEGGMNKRKVKKA